MGIYKRKILRKKIRFLQRKKKRKQELDQERKKETRTWPRNKKVLISWFFFFYKVPPLKSSFPAYQDGWTYVGRSDERHRRTEGPSPPPLWDILLRISQKDFIFINIRPLLSSTPFEFLCSPRPKSGLSYSMMSLKVARSGSWIRIVFSVSRIKSFGALTKTLATASLVDVF